MSESILCCIWIGGWQNTENYGTTMIDKTSLYKLIDRVDKIFVAYNQSVNARHTSHESDNTVT